MMKQVLVRSLLILDDVIPSLEVYSFRKAEGFAFR